MQLLHKLSIHAADGPQKLLKVRLIQYSIFHVHYDIIYINDECICVFSVRIDTHIILVSRSLQIYLQKVVNVVSNRET